MGSKWTKARINPNCIFFTPRVNCSCSVRPQRIEIVAFDKQESAAAAIGAERVQLVEIAQRTYVVELNESSSSKLKLMCSSFGAWPKAQLEWRWTRDHHTHSSSLLAKNKEKKSTKSSSSSSSLASLSSSGGELEESRLAFELAKVEWQHHLSQLSCVVKSRHEQFADLAATVTILVKCKFLKVFVDI